MYGYYVQMLNCMWKFEKVNYLDLVMLLDISLKF